MSSKMSSLLFSLDGFYLCEKRSKSDLFSAIDATQAECKLIMKETYHSALPEPECFKYKKVAKAPRFL